MYDASYVLPVTSMLVTVTVLSTKKKDSTTETALMKHTRIITQVSESYLMKLRYKETSIIYQYDLSLSKFSNRILRSQCEISSVTECGYSTSLVYQYINIVWLNNLKRLHTEIIRLIFIRLPADSAFNIFTITKHARQHVNHLALLWCTVIGEGKPCTKVD